MSLLSRTRISHARRKISQRSIVRRLLGFAFALIAAPGTAQTELPQLVRRVAPAVVTIKTQGASANSVGTGFLISSDGKIASSLHVLQGASQAVVELASGDIYGELSVVGFDAKRDLVILKIPGFGLPSLVLGDSNRVDIAQPVLTIGSPRGLSGTVTNGIVSAIRDHPEGYKVIQG